MYKRDRDSNSKPPRRHPHHQLQQPGAQTNPSQQDRAPATRRHQTTALTGRPHQNETSVGRPTPTAAPGPRFRDRTAHGGRSLPNAVEEALFDEPIIGGYNIPRNHSSIRDLEKQGLLYTERAPDDDHSMTFFRATDFGLASQPSDASSHGEPDMPSEGRGLDAKVPRNSIGIGIETEFFLRAKSGPRDQSPRRQRQDAAGFCRDVKKLYNEQVSSTFPRMESIFERDCIRWPEDRHDTWILMRDSTMCTQKPPCEHCAF